MAANGVSPSATQNFTLTVDTPPSVASGHAGSFTVAAAGTPTPGLSDQRPAHCPAASRFTDNGDGTATLAVTPGLVATTILHGHQGSNRDRVAGRWHGHVFPTGPVQILVQIQHDHHWTTTKTIQLTVRHLRGQG